MLDPDLEETLQHRWCVKGMNVKPEIIWSQIRSRFTPGFESELERGVEMKWYSQSIALQR